MPTRRQALRQRRRLQGLTQEAIARGMGVATTAYRDWERGQSTPLPGFRPRLARELDVTMVERDRLLHEGEPSAAPEELEVPSRLGHLAALEQGASELWTFETIAVPGLLQTAAYATAVERSAPGPVSDADVARWVASRMARQAVLDRRPAPLRLSAVLDESVLWRVADGPEVMNEQLGHLAAMAERPHVEIQVLPLDAGVFVFGNFIVLTSPGDSSPSMACVEDCGGMNYLDRDHEVNAHSRLFAYLRSVALSPERSVDLIRTTARERYR